MLSKAADKWNKIKIENSPSPICTHKMPFVTLGRADINEIVTFNQLEKLVSNSFFKK